MKTTDNTPTKVKQLYKALPEEAKNELAQQVGRSRRETIEKSWLRKYHQLSVANQLTISGIINKYLATEFTPAELCQTIIE